MTVSGTLRYCSRVMGFLCKLTWDACRDTWENTISAPSGYISQVRSLVRKTRYQEFRLEGEISLCHQDSEKQQAQEMGSLFSYRMFDEEIVPFGAHG